MKIWLRLLFITLTVGGGFTGFVSTFQFLLSSSEKSGNVVNLLLTVIFLGLYAFVIVSGLMFVHDPERTGPLLAAFALQIPLFSSPLVLYKFAAGLSAGVTFGGPEKAGNIGISFNGQFFLGSSWKLEFQQQNPWRIGINFVALAMFILLWRARPTRRNVASTLGSRTIG